MKTIYCISGLGADERAFSKLKIDGYSLRVIPWLMPEPGETIQHYATRMRAIIDDPEPILMGLSFGGMLCAEIAKQIPVQKLILISSVKSKLSNSTPLVVVNLVNKLLGTALRSVVRVHTWIRSRV